MFAKPTLRFVAIAAIATALSVMAALLPTVEFNLPGLSQLSPPVVMAQRIIQPAQISQQVYELMPDLPLENQYVNVETGEVAANNTLVDRLIQYHAYVKVRPPYYRLDWKLTMADYLGAHQWLVTSTYPGADTLRPNPMAGDVAAIGQLNRAQRDQLVNALVSIFNTSGDGDSTSAPTPSSGSTSAPIRTEPGAAQLLLP